MTTDIATPYDQQILELKGLSYQDRFREAYEYRREGYLAAVADYADLLAVLASVENVIKECQKPGDVWTAKRLMAGLGPQVRAALAKHSSPQAR